MSVIAWPYRLLALAALCIAVFGFGWLKGASHVQAQWNAAKAAQQQNPKLGTLHPSSVRIAAAAFAASRK